MTAEFEQRLGDALADGRITEADAEVVRTFAQFLRESGPPPVTADGVRAYPTGHPLADRAARVAHRDRWLPFMRGEADGPIGGDQP